MKKIFFKFSLLASALFLCYACQTATTTETAVAKDSVAVETTTEPVTTTENTNQETRTLTYRSDGYRPGIASEWISVKTGANDQNILEIAYWNSNDENKTIFEIVSQKFVDGEISGYSGELRFPGDTEATGFGIIEDRFNMGKEGQEGQEFTQEENN